MNIKVNRLFEIDEYTVYPNDDIEVWTIKNGEIKEYLFSKLEFEDCLRDTDRLDWIADEMIGGQYKQTSGKIPAEKFWEQQDAYIKDMLYEFILLKKVDSVKVFDSVWQGLNSIKDEKPEIQISQDCNPTLKNVLENLFPNAKYSSI